MISDSRVDLRVPFVEKDQAKVHGAQGDTENRTWYAPPGTNLDNFKRWLPRGVLTESTEPSPVPAKAAEKGIALTELLGRVKGVIDEVGCPPFLGPLQMGVPTEECRDLRILS
jgi:exodeoxyribonuclease VII large subunit